jgi:hypothetical protein
MGPGMQGAFTRPNSLTQFPKDWWKEAGQPDAKWGARSGFSCVGGKEGKFQG